MDLMDLFDRGTAWTASKVANVKPDQLDAKTPCTEWDVRTLLNHCFAALEMFKGAAEGKPAAPPTGPPPELLTEDPARQYEDARQATMAAFGKGDAVEKHGQILGIAFVDQLVHGWDLAQATGQDATIPTDLAETAFTMVNGRLSDEVRGALFAPAQPVSDDASAQEKLIAYAGRHP